VFELRARPGHPRLDLRFADKANHFVRVYAPNSRPAGSCTRAPAECREAARTSSTWISWGRTVDDSLMGRLRGQIVGLLRQRNDIDPHENLTLRISSVFCPALEGEGFGIPKVGVRPSVRIVRGPTRGLVLVAGYRRPYHNRSPNPTSRSKSLT
jgi:hypothetical protein